MIRAGGNEMAIRISPGGKLVPKTPFRPIRKKSGRSGTEWTQFCQLAGQKLRI